MRDQIDFLTENDRPFGGTTAAVLVSVMIHALMLAAVAIYKPKVVEKPKEDLVRFVQILRQAPTAAAPQFTEAPGAKRQDRSRMDAAYSDANRRASMPQPTGEQPTTRPGDPSRVYVPGDPRPRGPQAPQMQQQMAAAPQQQQQQQQQQRQTSDDFTYQVPANRASAASSINWNSAIREIGKVASLSGEGVGASGGEEGFAESGPISFETQWYDWGEYAQHMVARIRHHWYANMPGIIRMGVRGVVTIRFTIQRSGEITNVQLISSSEIPPFDFAAKRAIELASPLNPLPADFPNPSEQVTAQFYYNMSPPKR